jgi:hypothetical protein
MFGMQMNPGRYTYEDEYIGLVEGEDLIAFTANVNFMYNLANIS